MVAIPFNLSKSMDLEAEKGLGLCGSDGLQLSVIVAGNGSPVGEQAPTGSFYLDNTDGDFWQKVGPDTTEGDTGWLRNGKGTSFSNATDFESFISTSTSTTNSSTPFIKFSGNTGPKEGGRYYIGWSYEISHSKKDNIIGHSVQVDTGAGLFDIFATNSAVAKANTWQLVSGFFILVNEPAAPLGYTLLTRFNEQGTGTAKMRRMSLILYRIGD